MRLNARGFILIMAIFSLFILCLTTFLLSQAWIVTRHLNFQSSPPRQDLWLFSHQLENELLRGSNIQVTNNTLSFQLDQDSVRFFLSGDRLVRQVNEQGYEIVLLNIRSVSFEQRDHLITMSIQDTKGKTELWRFLPGIY